MECEAGEIAWTSRADTGVGAEAITVRPVGKRLRRIEPPALTHIDRAGVLHAFARAIQSGETPETAGSANLSSLALMQAAVKAAQSGLPVRVQPL